MGASGRRHLRRGGPLGGVRLPLHRATVAADALPALGVAARTAGGPAAGGAPFVVLGGIVSTYLALVVFTDPIGVTPHPHCLAYQTGVQHEIVWAVLYVLAVIGPALIGLPLHCGFRGAQPGGPRRGRCAVRPGVRVTVVHLRRGDVGACARAHGAPSAAT